MSNNSQPGSPSKSPSRNGTSGIMSKAEQDPHALPIIFPPTAKRGGSKFERLREALVLCCLRSSVQLREQQLPHSIRLQ